MVNLHYQQSDDITAYTYKADIVCPLCIIDALPSGLEDLDFAPGDVETALDAIAKLQGIDRCDETTYDSGEFPKVIFRDQVEDGNVCGVCFGTLEDAADLTIAQHRPHGRHM